MIARIVLAVTDDELCKKIERTLSSPGMIVDTVSKRDLLWDHVSKESGDLVIVSRAIAPHPDQMRLLLELPEHPSVIVLFDNSDAEDEAAFVASGCAATLSVDLPFPAIEKAVLAVLESRIKALEEAVTSKQLIGAEPRTSDFVSKSPAMHTFMRVVSRVVRSDVSLLILGETGVGKERLARAIHAEGHRSEGPFIAVNCGALPESLLESELFGHERGAFTGATRDRRGWFELAHGGTIFLDEIGELQSHLQVKLLRVLQDRYIQRVGSEKSIKIDVRIMAATNCDLAGSLTNGSFRKDLFYRLSVVTLTVPPLCERKEDIPELVENYINHFYASIGCQVTGITPEALEALNNYAWPGNVRELINVIERGMILCEGDQIELADLPESMSNLSGAPLNTSIAAQGTMPLPSEILRQPLRQAKREALEKFEYAYLAGLLQESGGRIAKTAEQAGIQPRSLHEKMKHYGLKKEDFRPTRDST